MAVVCPVCGKSSADPEFCDHCNAELGHTGTVPPSLCPIPGGAVELTAEQRQVLRRPEAWIKLVADGAARRVHWIGCSEAARWQPYLKERQGVALASLAPCQVIEDPGGAWVLVEADVQEWAPWAELAREDPGREMARLLDSLEAVAIALEALHGHGLVWTNFDPTALERTAAGVVRIVNLDLAVCRAGTLLEGLPTQSAFLAPEIARCLEKDVGPASDVFHLAIFAYYWLARLLPDGFAGSGLETFAHAIPPLRIFRPDLIPSVAAVLRRGLLLDASQRWRRPGDLVEALREAARRFVRRLSYEGGLRWRIGAHTRTGRAKQAMGRGNEDNVVVRTFVDPERSLLAVADGISTCDIGSGALASLISTIVLENTFSAEDDAATFLEKIPSVCRRAAETLVDWATEKGYREQLLEGADLMGTTLTAGWLEGRYLHLANLGDSRAYLLDGSDLEQLTVDGDLGCGLLAAGTPPEEVRELGSVAKALRECIGGCAATAEGQIAILDESCHPVLSTWPLLPDDIVILCSDGLVEEGIFLDPVTMADLALANRQLPPEQLALLLADAADSLQRLPSTLEPEGFGDNITCIVVKIEKLPVSS